MRRAVTLKEARAIRQDQGNGAGRNPDRDPRCVAPMPKCRLVIGKPPERDILHMDRGDFMRLVASPRVYASRRPTCRYCGELIEDGEDVVRFDFYPDGFDSPRSHRGWLHYRECERTW